MKRISVVIPTFNAERFLEDALYSVANQIGVNVELIIVDGGSTDSTSEIVRRCRGNIADFISEPDEGVPDALNKGFKRATGDILCWLNADDIYLSPYALKHACDRLSLADCSFGYGHSVVLNEEGTISKSLLAWRVDADAHKLGTNIFTGSLFFSRDIWLQFGGFSGKYKIAFEYELLDYFMSISTPVLIDSFLAGFRMYPGTLSDRGRFQMKAELISLRGLSRHPRQERLNAYLRRARGLVRDRLLFRTLSNSWRDVHAGRNWRTVFAREAATSGHL